MCSGETLVLITSEAPTTKYFIIHLVQAFTTVNEYTVCVDKFRKSEENLN